MANEPSLESMRKNSRNAAIGTAMGAAIMFGAIAFSVVRLEKLNQQVDGLNLQIDGKKSELTDLLEEYEVKKVEMGRLRAEHDELNDQLTVKRQELDRVQSWGDLFRVCALGGQIAIAGDASEAQNAYEELTTIKESVQNLADALDDDEHTRTERVVDVIEELQPLVDQWNASENWVLTDLRRKILTLGGSAKAVFESAPSTVQEFEAELARLLYDQAIAVVARLHFAQASQWDQQPAVSDRGEFWRLYWGDLVFIESGEFASAMVGVRNALELANGTKPESLTSEIKQLATAYHNELGKWPRLSKELLPEG